MKLFEIRNNVNKNKKLSFTQKALLNQITEFNLNKMPFIATNQYLADYWGCDLSTIKRTIASLKEFGYISVTTERKKHTTGGATWYNKRYITANIDIIVGQQSEILTLEIVSEPTVEQPSIIVEVLNDDDEPIGGVFPEQENEFTRFFAEPKAPLDTAGSANEYSHEAMLEFISNDSVYTATMLKKFPNADPDADYTSGMFFYILQNNEANMEKYRAITSRLQSESHAA